MKVRPFQGRARTLWLVLAAAALAVAARASVGAWRAYRFERGLVFQSHPLGGARPEDSRLPGALDVEYGRCEGAALRGWYAPPRNGAAILFVHGAAGDRRSLSPEAALLRSAGYGVLVIDLPGTGASGGRITGGRNETAAIAAAVDWLARHGAARIGAVSISLGSIFLSRAAAAEPRLRAVVLEAPSTSIIDRIRVTHRDRGAPTVLAATLAWLQEGTNPWRDPSTDAVASIAPRPLLLVTGRHDDWASPEMAGRLLARAGPTARLEVFECGHGGYWGADPPRYEALLLSFFASALAP